MCHFEEKTLETYIYIYINIKLISDFLKVENIVNEIMRFETLRHSKLENYYLQKFMLMEEKIIRPTTKPEAIKGKLLKYQGTDYCEFMPQAQGEPQY